jgi:hypothetical protein
MIGTEAGAKMRVSTAFSRLLQVPVASVAAVILEGWGGGRSAPARAPAYLSALRLSGLLGPPTASSGGAGATSTWARRAASSSAS